jgi:hypothetical protein
MTDLALNLLFGLVGALIGAFAGIYAVRHSHILQAEANLRSLLVAQRLALQMLASADMAMKQRHDYVPIFQAYQNLRTVYFWRKRAALDNAWRNYKGDYEDSMPLFGTQTVEDTSKAMQVTSRSFTHEEVLEKLDGFLKCLGQ